MFVNAEIVDSLEANLAAYKQQKAILHNAMASSGREITAEDVMELKVLNFRIVIYIFSILKRFVINLC